MDRLLSEQEIAHELADFQIVLSAQALSQLHLYFELLLHWNRRINLTGLRDPRTIVRRLFGESLYLSKLIELRGWLVDIGSGAGFPGLALKLVAPDLTVTLIEARRKKSAFLKEIVRRCGFAQVEVVAERFETWVSQRESDAKGDLITTRAVDVSPALLRHIASVLAPAGRVAFFTSRSVGEKIAKTSVGWSWRLHAMPGDEKTAVLVLSMRQF